MVPSAGCFDLIKGFEKFRPTAYRDVRGIWTIGWGPTKGVQQGDTCTIAQGEGYLAQDVGDTVAYINAQVRVSLTQNQFDALGSLGFNIGDGNFEHPQVLRALNA